MLAQFGLQTVVSRLFKDHLFCLPNEGSIYQSVATSNGPVAMRASLREGAIYGVGVGDTKTCSQQRVKNIILKNKYTLLS